MTALHDVTRINNVKAKWIKQQHSKYSLCGDREETINEMIRKYSNLAHKERKTWHDWVMKEIHRELCKKL